MSKLQPGQLVNRRRFGSAYRRAIEVVHEQPGDAHAWFQVALAANLLNWPDRALAAHIKAKECSNFTSEIDGSFHRDHANRAIRLGVLPVASRHLGLCHELHVEPFFRSLDMPLPPDDMLLRVLPTIGDRIQNSNQYRYANLTAVWLDMFGRMLTAKGEPSVACLLHAAADKLWQQLGQRAEKQWQYNNLVHWLKAAVQISLDEWAVAKHDLEPFPTLGETINMLTTRIKTDNPPDSKNRFDEARLLLLPGVGPQVYDAVATIRTWTRRLSV